MIETEYDGVMVLGIFAMVATAVQPICTRSDFQEAFGSSLQSDYAFVARAAFEDYLEQVQKIDVGNYDRNTTPIEQLQDRLEATIKADGLFDDLMGSLSVLSSDRSWKRNIIDLRRSVLLEARKANNPWPATIWVNLSDIVQIPVDTAQEIDAFLIDNIDEDRTDRFSASVAILAGNSEDCRIYEKRAMVRWNQYISIIEPYINEDVESVLYPQLSNNDGVRNLMSWMMSNVDNVTTLENAQFQLAAWNSAHTQQKLDAIKLIRGTRATLGFDPWSRGCGIQNYSRQSRIKNELIKKTAAIQETNKSYIKILLSLLNPEQLQEFKDGG